MEVSNVHLSPKPRNLPLTSLSARMLCSSISRSLICFRAACSARECAAILSCSRRSCVSGSDTGWPSGVALRRKCFVVKELFNQSWRKCKQRKLPSDSFISRRSTSCSVCRICAPDGDVFGEARRAGTRVVSLVFRLLVQGRSNSRSWKQIHQGRIPLGHGDEDWLNELQFVHSCS